MHLAREHDNGFVVRSNGVLDSNMTAFDGPVTFRLVRVASTITAYVWNEGTTNWDTQSGWERTVTDASLYVGLAGYVNLQGYVAATFKNFVFNANSTPGYTTTGEYLSSVYDAGHPVDWKSLKFQSTQPVDTDIQLQIAVSDSERGPWTYRGPDGTATTYFTADTTNLMGQSFIGRYARYKAILSGDGTVTPTLSRVEFGYSGSLPSQSRTFAFDPAGNITEKSVATDSSSITETRTYNDLNQLTQNVIDDGATPVTWTYTHDANGNMTSKSDGTDTYTYVWNVDNQLERVELNSSTVVSYVYDSGSRMIQRVEGTVTTNYTWDGWDLIREDKSGSVTQTTKYLVPEGEILAFERDGNVLRARRCPFFHPTRHRRKRRPGGPICLRGLG